MIMKNMPTLLFFLVVGYSATLLSTPSLSDQIVREELLSNLKSRIYQYRLDSGLRVICIQATNTNMVRVGSYVEVGSSHEEPTEWGMAHILEHMVFKGTLTRKEGELDKLCNRFGMQTGRDYNAHTSFDHTFYYFDTDQANWHVFADVVADSAQNLLVNSTALDSELQAISQEIKLGKRDQNSGFALKDFLPLNHRLAHDVIGYKEEVLRFKADDVMAFYNKHYTPEKTTFFVCGNVNPEEVLMYAQKAFDGFNRVGAPARAKGVADDLPFYAGFTQTNRVQYHTKQYKSICFYWQAPAVGSVDEPALRYVAAGLSRRLTQKYVEQLGYCFSAYAGVYFCQMSGLFYSGFTPRPEYEQFDFTAAIKAEIDDIMTNGLTPAENKIIRNDLVMELVYEAENPKDIPYDLVALAACSYDPVNSFFDFKERLMNVTQESVCDVAFRYLRPFLMNKRETVPLPLDEQLAWDELQKKVLAHEKNLLEARARTDISAFAEIENAVLNAEPQSLTLPSDIEYNQFVLPNGLTVYWYQTQVSPRCSCGLVVQDAERFWVPLAIKKKSFARSVASDMLMNGTDQYSEKELKDVLDLNGVQISASASAISVSGLKNNIEEGLRLMRLVLDKEQYHADYLERKKKEEIDNIKAAQNDLWSRFHDYVAQTLSLVCSWKFGKSEEIANLKEVVVDDVRSVVSLLKDPSTAAAIIVGNFTEIEVRELARRYFGDLSVQATCTADSFDVPDFSIAVNDHLPLPVEHALVVAIRVGSVQGTVDSACLELLKNYFKKKIWNIRERTGLFYSGGSFYRGETKRLPGAINVYAQTTPGNVTAVQDELRLVLESACAPDQLNKNTFFELQDEFKRSCGRYCTTAGTAFYRMADSLIDDVPTNQDRLFMEQVAALTYEQFSDAVVRYCGSSAWSFITVGAKA